MTREQNESQAETGSPTVHDSGMQKVNTSTLLSFNGVYFPQVDIQKVWLLFSSVVLAFAFVFGNSIRQLYEAVIFLFVIHPYDVGDWLLFGNDKYQVCRPALLLS